MRRSLSIALLLIAPYAVFASIPDTAAQEPVYYEPAPDGMTRFFYDDNYFLADKQCDFKAIERVATYDFREQVFDGEITDFNNQGRVVLRGYYRDGKKDGDFKAYHPNGQPKWEVTYVQDIPQGTWKFYYPDGKPLLEVVYKNRETLIYNFWDIRGRQRVEQGKGKYEFAINADGYNEFGYVRYNRSGRVIDGLPDGNWVIEYIFSDGKKEGAGHEFYQKGMFVRGYEAFKDEVFTDAPRYRLVPVDAFFRAEEMIGKTCSIDDYAGFTGYLAKHLEEWFEGKVNEMPDPLEIEFTVAVNKDGAPQKVDVKTNFEVKRYADLLEDALQWVGFWFPSYAEEGFIDDELTVTVEAFPDAIERKLRFFDVKIERARGI